MDFNICKWWISQGWGKFVNLTKPLAILIKYIKLDICINGFPRLHADDEFLMTVCVSVINFFLKICISYFAFSPYTTSYQGTLDMYMNGRYINIPWIISHSTYFHHAQFLIWTFFICHIYNLCSICWKKNTHLPGPKKLYI